MGVKVREKIQGSGVWWVFISHRGKRTSRKIGSEKAALKAKETLEARLKLGIEALPKAKPLAPTLQECYDRFERLHMRTLSEKTCKSYEGSFRLHILPKLGKKRLDEITKDTIAEFVTELVGRNISENPDQVKTFAKDTVRLIVASLRVLLSNACERKVIVENPAGKPGKLYRQAKKVHEKIDPLNHEETAAFLAAVYEYDKGRHYPTFLTAIHTGMREGELAALQWGDIDFAGKFIVVRRNISLGRVKDTKTGKIRRVDMSDELAQTLAEFKKARHEAWLKKGSNEIPDWVFHGDAETVTDARPMDMNAFARRHHRKCLELAKLRQIRFHDWRHTYASLQLQNGAPMAYLKNQLGHSSIKVTVDIYGHLEPGANRGFANKLPGRSIVQAKAEHAG